MFVGSFEDTELSCALFLAQFCIYLAVASETFSNHAVFSHRKQSCDRFFQVSLKCNIKFSFASKVRFNNLEFFSCFALNKNKSWHDLSILNC